jgi:hypothetical protein
MNRRIRALLGTAALLAAMAAFLPLGASASDLQLAPIPDMYVGAWWHHGAGIMITKFEGSPEGGSAVAQWRTYTWCQDPITKKPNPPPCDTFVGNFIEDGGIASIALLHPQGQDDRSLSGVLVATSDPAGGFGKWGGSVQFTMLPGNMLLVDTNTGSIMFCGENTDFSQYSPYPCGA